MAYIEELAKALHHENPEIRVRVAKALQELEDPRATMPLIDALNDECVEVRRAVAWALQSCADERALPTFIGMLRDDNDSVRLWAVFGLVRIGDETAVEALIESLKDPYDSVRMQAIVALSRIGDRRAIDPLIEALKDDDRGVKRTAIIHLREVFGVNIGSNHEAAMRLMKESSRRQSQLNEKMKLALKVISELEQAQDMVRDDELYPVLAVDHGIDEDEVSDLLFQLMRKGLVHRPRRGFTQICL